MLEYCELKSRKQDVRLRGYYKGMGECLEDALRSGIDMTHLKLSGINLSHCNLDGADLSGSDFSGANLTGINLSEATLNQCIFSHASMVDACLAESVMKKSVFYETSFSATELAGSEFEECVFSCPSFFQLKFQDIKIFRYCSYYNDGQYCAMNGVPVVLLGLPQLVAVMDHHIMIGHTFKTLPAWRETLDIRAEGINDVSHSMARVTNVPYDAPYKGQIVSKDQEQSFFRVHAGVIQALYNTRNNSRDKARAVMPSPRNGDDGHVQISTH